MQDNLNMNSDYKILKEHKLLVQKYTGVFCFDEFFEHIKEVTADPDWKNVHKIITDLRDINLDLFYKNMDKFLEFRNENILRSYYNVFIVNTPLSTAVLHLYKEKLNSERYKYEYCSTTEYALSFLDLEDVQDEIEQILDKF